MARESHARHAANHVRSRDPGGLSGKIKGEPVVVSFGGDRLDIFVQRPDNTIDHKWRNDNGTPWKPTAEWSSLGDPIGGDGFCAVSWGNNSLHVFAQGADNDVWYKWGNGHDWNPSGGRWKPLGKKILGRPAAVAWSEDRLDVLVQGTDKAVWHKACDGHRWQDWESLGGQIIGRPSVVSWGPNRLDVFVRGLDNGLHQKALLGAQWYPSQLGWYSLGGGISDVPSTVSWGPGRLDVFVIGLDGVSIYHKWYAEGWSGFTPLGGNALTGPRAVTAKENSLDVVIQGRDRSVWHRSWNGRAWVPAAAWRSFDGIVDGISRYSVPEARFSSRSLAAGETVTCCTGTEKYVS